MQLKDLCLLVKKEDNTALLELVRRFKNSARKNSFVNGKFNEDCYQEQMVRLIKCAKNFTYEDKDYSEYIKRYLKKHLK